MRSDMQSYPERKLIKCGNLYHFALDCPDIEKFFLWRLFRKFGYDYIPFTLKSYDRLFLRNGKSKFGRKLLNYCKKHNIETYIVQEGSGVGRMSHGHIPMRADYFLCPKDMKEWWVKQGIKRGQIMTYKYQKKEYKGILFMSPLYIYKRDFLHPYTSSDHNAKVMKVICEYMNKDVVFKLHRKNIDINCLFFPPHRLIEGDALELIKRFDKIYCFSTSSIVKDCEMQEKKVILVDK